MIIIKKEVQKMLIGNVLGQLFVPILLLIALVGVSAYLLIKAWKNRKETSTAITVVISLLSLFMIFGGLYALIFTISFGWNT